MRALLSALVDDQVDAQTRHLAERHLTSCNACRTMLDEAEALDDLMARDSDALTGGPVLPAGFEAAVIERALLERPTVRRSLVTWTGWFAAAACLTLAVLIWSFDRNMWINNTVPQVAKSLDAPVDARADAHDETASSNVVRTANYQRRSWTFDGELPDDALLTSFNDGDVPSSADEPTMSKIQPAQMPPTFEDDPDQAWRDAAALVARGSNLSDEDVQTLYSVSLLMETLADAELHNFAEVDRIRRITEYDELLPRINQTKQRLSAEDRAIVRVAESILLRIVRGPVTETVARELWSDASKFELAEALQAMSEHVGSRPSL